MNRDFLVCSGQGRARPWGILSPHFPTWWRLENDNGTMRTFKTMEAAQRVADRLTVLNESYRLAKDRAAKLRRYADAGPRAWADANRYAGVRASLWGADPFGFFTANLPELPR